MPIKVKVTINKHIKKHKKATKNYSFFKVNTDDMSKYKFSTENNMCSVPIYGYKTPSISRLGMSTLARKYRFMGLEKDFERIRHLPHEVGIIIDKDGRRLLPDKIGTVDSLHYTAEEIGLFKGKQAIFIHNHPNGTSFSFGDHKASSNAEIYKVIALAGEYNFEMKYGDFNRSMFDLLMPEMSRIHMAVLAKYNKLQSEGKMTASVALKQASHMFNRVIAERFGFTYTYTDTKQKSVLDSLLSDEYLHNTMNKASDVVAGQHTTIKGNVFQQAKAQKNSDKSIISYKNVKKQSSDESLLAIIKPSQQKVEVPNIVTDIIKPTIKIAVEKPTDINSRYTESQTINSTDQQYKGMMQTSVTDNAVQDIIQQKDTYVRLEQIPVNETAEFKRIEMDKFDSVVSNRINGIGPDKASPEQVDLVARVASSLQKDFGSLDNIVLLFSLTLQEGESIRFLAMAEYNKIQTMRVK